MVLYSDEGEVTVASRSDGREKIQKDLDDLLSQSAMLAKTLLIRNGEFFPFAATVGMRGKFALVTPVPDTDTPTSQDVLDAIVRELGATLPTIRACAIVAMAATEAGVDAVRIELEHAAGPSLVIALPYARGELGAFAYGDMDAHRIAPRLWTTPATKAKPPTATPRPSKAKATESGPASSPKKPSGATSRAMPEAHVTPDAPATPNAREARPAGGARQPRPARQSRPALHAQPALF